MPSSPWSRPQLFLVSDERDQWEERLIEAENQAYKLGLTDGWTAGYEQARRQMDAEWNRVARGVAHSGPSHDELDKRRYPPEGRESWLVP